jgi:hypothetical protein
MIEKVAQHDFIDVNTNRIHRKTGRACLEIVRRIRANRRLYDVVQE